MASSSPSASTKVKFIEQDQEKTTTVKHVPTQKYNRQEIQKRLEVEEWMDDNLKDLYQTDVRL